jgi:hypothetical protein
LIWGKYDFRVPPNFAIEELDSYGTSEKTLKIINRSAHYVHFNQPDSVYLEIFNFIQTQL